MRDIPLKWWIVIIAGVVGAVMGLSAVIRHSNNANVNSFQACKDAGFPILESYPEQCMANGTSFTNPDQLPK